jgi:hypothetical protein
MDRSVAATRWHGRRVALAVVMIVALSGCTRSSDVALGQGERTIPQPTVPGDLAVAPAGDRLDTVVPTFSDPTNITNPFFPVSLQRSVLLLGQVDGEAFRSEVTLLPYTRIIEWEGQRVETLVSQYNAFLDGRIEEIAYDYYAQADDGSVWYFGEDVFDFRDGTIVVTEGTWLAGQDGPAAMIMPADPKTGGTYRPENAPPLVFEEVTVTDTGQALSGPLGPIPDGLLVRELHLDGATEDKIFAPGYGEFRTSDGKDLEALALAVPTDAAEGALPPDLLDLTDGALAALEGARSGRWRSVDRRLEESTAAWDRYRAQGSVPRLIEPLLTSALDRLTKAVDARSVDAAASAAIEVARSGFDLQLRYRPTAEVDLARMGLWAAQLILDADRKDLAGVGADAYALDYLRDRLLAALEPSDLGGVTEELAKIQAAVLDEELQTAAEAAGRIRGIVATILASTTDGSG